jgi:hypothetical protein
MAYICLHEFLTAKDLKKMQKKTYHMPLLLQHIQTKIMRSIHHLSQPIRSTNLAIGHSSLLMRPRQTSRR